MRCQILHYLDKPKNKTKTKQNKQQQQQNNQNKYLQQVCYKSNLVISLNHNKYY